MGVVEVVDVAPCHGYQTDAAVVMVKVMVIMKVVVVGVNIHAGTFGQETADIIHRHVIVVACSPH
jgi:hypothetical protein